MESKQSPVISSQCEQICKEFLQIPTPKPTPKPKERELMTPLQEMLIMWAP